MPGIGLADYIHITASPDHGAFRTYAFDCRLDSHIRVSVAL